MSNSTSDEDPDEAALISEIRTLEGSLVAARSKLTTLRSGPPPSFLSTSTPAQIPHALLLLSDSALPLGSFAFSSGLESYLAHHPSSSTTSSFNSFLRLSISSIASTTLPYVTAAYRSPSLISQLDNDLDASTPCTVARRASVAQGLALLSVWERSLRQTSTDAVPASSAASEALRSFSRSLKLSDGSAPPEDTPNGHLAPLWSLVCASLSLSLPDTTYVFLLNHAKAVVSAAVRAGVMGPYQAQGILVSEWLQGEIRRGMAENWEKDVEEAGQTVPVLDLWVGRHELLYSRIFNS